MPRFFLSGQRFKMRKFCTIFLFFLYFLSANLDFFSFFKPNFRPKNCSFLPKFSSEIVLIWFQKMLFSVFAQRKWVTDGGKLRLIRRVKVQKKNRILNVQKLPSAHCWQPYVVRCRFSVDRPSFGADQTFRWMLGFRFKVLIIK